MSYDIEICLKVSQERWIRSLKSGTACFNPIDCFIKKAEIDGNNEQGDKYEGIFGRIKKTDARLHELRERLGADLEIIDDGDYVLLRRYSTRNIPIFCTYGVLREEITINPDSVHREGGKMIGTARYDFPDKIYDGFLDDDDVWGFYCSAGHLHTEIEKALTHNKIRFEKAKISYDIDLSKEFLLTIDDSYPEVTHKRMDLSYQHEIRYYLLDFPQAKEYLLTYKPLSDSCCGIAPKALYMELNCVCHLMEE